MGFRHMGDHKEYLEKEQVQELIDEVKRRTSGGGESIFSVVDGKVCITYDDGE